MASPRAASSRRAFTLIELLVVIAIIAILAVVVVLTLNPAQLLAQSRDANRLSDLDTLNHAIALYQEDQSGASSYSIGSSTTVYPSVADPAAPASGGNACTSLGMPFLPSGQSYVYHCAASTTYRNASGTAGWIPVNFAAISSGAPFGSLPVDPVNSTSSRLYYTYTTDGSKYELTAAMESSKYKLGGSLDAVSSDGGNKMSLVEKGTSLALEPLDYGDAALVGWWPLDEGSGTVAYDMSGTNATDSWNGAQVGTGGTYYVPGKVGAYAGAFDGSSTYAVNVASSSALNLTNAVTMIAWVKVNATGTDEKIISKRPSYVLTVFSTGVPETEIFIGGNSKDDRGVAGGTMLATGTWYQVAGTYNGSVLTTYVNGVLDRQMAVSGTMDQTAYAVNLGKTADGTNANLNGDIDDARVYNRALSAAEIAAIYNAEK